MNKKLPDIKPVTAVARLSPDAGDGVAETFPASIALPVLGVSAAFAKRVTGKRDQFSASDVLEIVQQDCWAETYVPRSMVLDYLIEQVQNVRSDEGARPNPDSAEIRVGNALDLIAEVPDESVNCVVTSTPYWGLRIYEDSTQVLWADRETCAYGHEQTPEGFLRHTVELLVALSPKLVADGSIWWNVMDSFNTRTQIRGNAAEALRAMQGKDQRGWHEHDARRYSAGHAFLKDGEQCLIPSRIAERASRCGFYVKSVITWAKTSSMPEPQNSRVSRNLEYVLHLTTQRTPKFSREPYHLASPEFGGRNEGLESEKLSDVWVLSTASGGDGHGAQFPTSLPGRCIALSSEPGDLVLDPFIGSGTTGVAALHHQRRILGFDISAKYAERARERIAGGLG